MTIEVKLLNESGYEQALMGMSTSFKDPDISLPDWWTPEKFEKAAKRAPKLAHMDGGHNKFLESIEIWVWVRAPRGWWQEADTYRLSTKQSESTMHTILKRPLFQRDFDEGLPEFYLDHLNELVQAKNWQLLKKRLPEGFFQARVWKMSYKTLRNVIAQRADHRLPEWPTFCNSILAQVEHPGLVVKED